MAVGVGGGRLAAIVCHETGPAEANLKCYGLARVKRRGHVGVVRITLMKSAKHREPVFISQNKVVSTCS